VVKGSVADYVVSYYNNVWKCTCPHHFYRKAECKHIRLVKNMYSLEDILSGKVIKKYSSSVIGLEKLIEDQLYTSDGIVAVFSQPEVGKTLFCLQESAFFVSKGLNVLFIGTEGNEISMIAKWFPKFRNRFGAPKGIFLLERRKTLEDLFEFFGFKVFLAYKGKIQKKKSGKEEATGKTEFRVIEKLQSKLEEVVKEKKINLIIVDSLTAPIKSKFYGSQQDNPAKAGALALLLTELLQIQEKYGCAIIVTAHESYNPANPYDTQSRAAGGINFYHFCKRIFYVDRRTARAEKNYRRIWVVRCEDIVPASRATAIKIDDLGIHSLSTEQAKKRFTQDELSKVEKVV
jgi:RecA/RadA recombinase